MSEVSIVKKVLYSAIFVCVNFLVILFISAVTGFNFFLVFAVFVIAWGLVDYLVESWVDVERKSKKNERYY